MSSKKAKKLGARKEVRVPCPCPCPCPTSGAGTDTGRGTGTDSGWCSRLRAFLCQPIQPQRRGCVARHAPVAAGRQTDGADFRAVGQAGALELGVEEAADKDSEPAAQLLRRVWAVELGLPGKIEHTLRRRAETEEVEQEEVVQFVR